MLQSAPWGRHGLVRFSLLLIALAWVAVARADNADYYYDAAGRLSGVVDPVHGTAVYNLDAAGNILSVSEQATTVLMVGGFSPATGSAGTVVTIGGNFAAALSTAPIVKFNGTAATSVTVVSATRLQATVPPGVMSGPVSVSIGSKSAQTTLSFTVPSMAAPVISNVSVTGGASGLPILVAPGASITITGSNFSTNNSQVYVNNFAGQVTKASTTSLTVTLPLAATTGHLTVETPNGITTTSGYVFVPPIEPVVPRPGGDPATQPNYPVADIGSYQSATVGTPLSLSGLTAGEIALVAVDVAPGQSIGAALTQSPVDATGISLYAPNGAVTLVGDPGNVGGFGQATAQEEGGLISPALYKPSPAAGTALIAVVPNETGESVTVLPFPATSTLVVPAADTVGTATNINLSQAGQSEYLTFSGTANTKATVYSEALYVTGNPGNSGLSPQSGDCIYAKIIAPDNYTKVAQTDLCANANNFGVEFPTLWMPDFTLPQTGQYTIIINYISSSGRGLLVDGTAALNVPLTLPISVWTFPADLTGNLINDNSTQLTFQVPGQSAEYDFNATQGENFSYIFNTNNTETVNCYSAWIISPQSALSATGDYVNGQYSGCPVPPKGTTSIPPNGSPAFFVTNASAGQWKIILIPFPTVPNSANVAQPATFPATMDLAVYQLTGNAVCPGQTASSTAPCPLTINNGGSVFQITQPGQPVVAQFTVPTSANGELVRLVVTPDTSLYNYTVNTSAIPSNANSVPNNYSENGGLAAPFNSGATVLPAGTYQVVVQTGSNDNISTSFGVGSVKLAVSAAPN